MHGCDDDAAAVRRVRRFSVPADDLGGGLQRHHSQVHQHQDQEDDLQRHLQQAMPSQVPHPVPKLQDLLLYVIHFVVLASDPSIHRHYIYMLIDCLLLDLAFCVVVGRFIYNLNNN